jgi:hypothetical protein
MSGGALEYMAAYMSGQMGASGFTTDPATTYGSKYFDVYNASSTSTSYTNRILGDATGEMGPFKVATIGDSSYYINSWYADQSGFILSSYSWFGRGGWYYNGVLAGLFYFAGQTGRAHSVYSFRLVLAF